MTTSRFADDLPLLAELAAHLLAEREAAYPRLIEEGKLQPDRAEAGLRAMKAVAIQWARIAAHRDLPPIEDYHAKYGAHPHELRAMLDSAAATARKRAAADPGNRDKADYAEAVETLARLQRPWQPGFPTPRCLFLHQLNQDVRRACAAGDTRIAA
jgi:hypothetical protein